MTTISTSIVFVVATVAVYARFGIDVAVGVASATVIAAIGYRLIRRKVRK